MKRIEDAPKELQRMFAILWEDCVRSASGISDYRDEVEHAFLRGFDTAMATNGLPQRPKRTIKTIISDAENVYALSSDEKLYALLTNGRWIKYPDLPQD